MLYFCKTQAELDSKVKTIYSNHYLREYDWVGEGYYYLLESKGLIIIYSFEEIVNMVFCHQDDIRKLQDDVDRIGRDESHLHY